MFIHDDADNPARNRHATRAESVWENPEPSVNKEKAVKDANKTDLWPNLSTAVIRGSPAVNPRR